MIGYDTRDHRRTLPSCFGQVALKSAASLKRQPALVGTIQGSVLGAAAHPVGLDQPAEGCIFCCQPLSAPKCPIEIFSCIHNTTVVL